MPKSSFWKSLWSETGRNTGKWISNGVFGNKGWATPKRMIIESDHSENDRNSNRSEESNDYLLDEIIKPAASEAEMFDIAVNADIQAESKKEVCYSMDLLLVAALQAFKDRQNNSIFLVKLRLGVIKLQQMGEHELASVYRKEILRLRIKKVSRAVGILLLFLFIFGGLLLVLRLG